MTSLLHCILIVPGFNPHNQTFTPKPDDGICMWSYMRFEWVKMPDDEGKWHGWDTESECFVPDNTDYHYPAWSFDENCWCNGSARFDYEGYLETLHSTDNDCQSDKGSEENKELYLNYLMSLCKMHDFPPNHRIISYEEFCNLDDSDLDWDENERQASYDDDESVLNEREERMKKRSF